MSAFLIPAVFRKVVTLCCIILLLFLFLLCRHEEYHRRTAVLGHCSECQDTGKLKDQLAVYSFPSEILGPRVLNESKIREKTPVNMKLKNRKSRGKIKVTHKKLSINLVVIPFLNYSRGTVEKISRRKQEYRTVMQRNLNHPLVNSIHLLTTDPLETMREFNNFTNQEKMIVAKVKSIAKMRDPFEYISLYLVGKDVIYANADIYLGTGFDRVDPLVMSRQSILYSLTRQVSDKEKCRHSDFCREHKYIGSHDTFLFHLKKPLTEDFLMHLDFPLPSAGMESVLMWAFETELRYCVLNPCRILETFHLHCSELRSRRIRVNRNGKAKRSPFTNRLTCR